MRDKFSDDSVTKQPRVPLGDDIVIRPTFRVIAKRGPVHIQAAAATSPIPSYDHAFVTFTMAERAEVPLDQRLVVLGGSLKTWSLPRLRVLSERAHVALWEPRGPLDAFLDGNRTKCTLLIDQTMMWPPAGAPRRNP